MEGLEYIYTHLCECLSIYIYPNTHLFIQEMNIFIYNKPKPNKNYSREKEGTEWRR